MKNPIDALNRRDTLEETRDDPEDQLEEFSKDTMQIVSKQIIKIKRQRTDPGAPTPI